MHTYILNTFLYTFSQIKIDGDDNNRTLKLKIKVAPRQVIKSEHQGFQDEMPPSCLSPKCDTTMTISVCTETFQSLSCVLADKSNTQLKLFGPFFQAV